MADPGTIVTHGRTSENEANLAPRFLKSIVERHGGTRLGRQELDAELLSDVPGALWTSAMLESCRIRPDAVPALERVVVGVIPLAPGGMMTTTLTRSASS